MGEIMRLKLKIKKHCCDEQTKHCSGKQINLWRNKYDYGNE